MSSVAPAGALAQDEIDRLVVQRARAGEEPSVTVSVYDFRRPQRVSKERLRTLEAMYERLARGIERWAIGRVREPITLTLLSVEQFSFGEFALSTPTPCASFLFDMADSGGQRGITVIGQEFAFYYVDRIFGGSGDAEQPSRALSRIERMALRSVADRTMQLVEEIWADHVALRFEMTSFESIPDILLQTANRDDQVLVANFKIRVRETTALLLISLPLVVLEQFFTTTSRRRLNPAAGSEQERAMARVLAEQSLRATRVTVAARLPEFRMSMRDIAVLAEGGVIATGIPHDTPVRVMVGRQERYVGTAGRVGQKLAVRLDAITTDPDAGAAAPEYALSFDPSVPAEALPSPTPFAL